MSDRFDIPAHEAEVVRVFLIDLPDDGQRQTFLDDSEGTWGPITALNPTSEGEPFTGMDRSYMDVVNPDDLDEVGLGGLLTEGYGIAEAEVAPLRARLDAIRDSVLIVSSKAFAGTAVAIEPRAPLRWVATLRQEPARGTMEQLHVESAVGQVTADEAAEPVKPALPMVLKLTLVLMAVAVLVAIVLGVSGVGE